MVKLLYNSQPREKHKVNVYLSFRPFIIQSEAYDLFPKHWLQILFVYC